MEITRTITLEEELWEKAKAVGQHLQPKSNRQNVLRAAIEIGLTKLEKESNASDA